MVDLVLYHCAFQINKTYLKRRGGEEEKKRGRMKSKNQTTEKVKKGEPASVTLVAVLCVD